MKTVVELIRMEESDQGTLGVLRVNKELFCATLEPPDRGNQQDLSCIPAGRYRCQLVLSPKFGRTYQVSGVPGRNHILFHAGNVVAHTKGCILLGSTWGKLKGDRAVLNSGDTFKRFLSTTGGSPEFSLNVFEVFYE